MDAGTLLSVGALVISASSGVIVAYLARKKAPEDRDAMAVDIAAKVLALVNDQLDDCERTKREMKADFDTTRERLAAEIMSLQAATTVDRGRITRLEAEVVRLGGDPSRINGG